MSISGDIQKTFDKIQHFFVKTTKSSPQTRNRRERPQAHQGRLGSPTLLGEGGALAGVRTSSHSSSQEVLAVHSAKQVCDKLTGLKGRNKTSCWQVM